MMKPNSPKCCCGRRSSHTATGADICWPCAPHGRAITAQALRPVAGARTETATVANLKVDAGPIVLTAFIAPFRNERQTGRALLEPGEFIEIFVDTPLADAELRDPKGLYRKARRGELANFTGIDSPCEAPEQSELRIDTSVTSAADAAERIVALLRQRHAGLTPCRTIRRWPAGARSRTAAGPSRPNSCPTNARQRPPRRPGWHSRRPCRAARRRPRRPRSRRRAGDET